MSRDHDDVIDRVTWRAVVIWSIAVLAYAIAVLARSSLSATGVEAALRFETSASALSMFAVLQLAVYAGMQIPAGIFLDRYGARIAITLGCALIAGGQVAMAFASSVPEAVGARILVGGGDSFVFISVIRLVPAWFPPRAVPLTTQLTGMFGQLGQLGSLVPFVALLEARGWPTAFVTAGSLAALIAALVAIVVRDGRARVVVDLPEEPEPAPAERDVAAVRPPTMLETWRDPGTRAGFWAHFVAPFPAYAFVLLWGSVYMTRAEGLSSDASLGVLNFYVVACLVMGPLLGVLAGRFPRRRLVLVLTVVGAQVLAWVLVLAWPGATPVPALLVLATTMGAAGPGSLVGFDYARETNPLRTLGLSTGMVNTGGFISTLTTMLLVGVALDLLGEGTPDLITDRGFTLAWLTLVPLWALGVTMLVRADGRLRRARAAA
ncbi:nitrate/nitrite transporter NarK [Flavimobilis soli]|uniref:Nitrate/nitrite transporter NarK n=1 Tax=Flavimobilis soli TaxID=442709 RepID=A0A2A9EB77_9MICO|nr:MFS transporter [Flavimobilis soli]PFG36198.1 nitrate/nitrite transporter NarK [Flavimobilis soli]